jgi:hypothetical protein
MGCSRASTVAQSVRHAVAIAMSMIAAAAWWSNRLPWEYSVDRGAISCSSILAVPMIDPQSGPSSKWTAKCRLTSQIGGRLKDIHRKEAGDVLLVA